MKHLKIDILTYFEYFLSFFFKNKKEVKIKNLYDKPVRKNIYRCHWTKKLISHKYMILAPAIVPGCGVHVAHPSYKKERKRSYELFTDFEKNCNTCKYLKRIPFKKENNGIIKGICTSKPINHPYLEKDNHIKFWPQDCMGLSCYKSRFK